MATNKRYSFDGHETSVGPVFDVAHFSNLKAIMTGMFGLVFAGLVGLGAVYFWNPDWIVSDPSEVWVNAHQEAKDLMRQHPLGVKSGVAVAAVFSLLCLLASASCVYSAISGNYYLRAGEGGLSLRVPEGFFGVLERDFCWAEIAKLTVVQEKKLGSMSRNAGNTGGELRIRTHEGFSRDIRLDLFREDAWLIHQRMEQARELQAATLAS